MDKHQEKLDRQFEFTNKIKNMNIEKMASTEKPLKAFVEWFGCQMNQRDTETLLGMIKNMNYELSEDITQADLVIFNTCSVRESAESKMFGKLGMLKTVKSTTKPDMIIGICGCMTQKEGAAEEILKKYRHIDMIFGTHNLYAFPELLLKVMNTKKSVIDVWDIDGEVIEDLPVQRESDLKAWVNIMYGCNNFCTYCIVPYVRGRERSRNPEDIIKEVQQLATEGYKEITLLGQNVNSYGKTLDQKYTFADLLRELDKIEGIERIRFMTPHPKDLSDDVIDIIANGKKLCEQIHLPLQSGSTRVLKTMNRHYTKEQYLALVNKIRERIPGVSISADIIVGFPGETEEDFLDTLDVVRQAKYDLAYTFIYSKRPGTPAEKMEEQIDDTEKHNRLNRLIELQNKICFENNKALEGQVFEVLVEGEGKSENGQMMGRTRSNKIINFKGDKELIGKLVKVKVTEGEKFWLRGELV